MFFKIKQKLYAIVAKGAHKKLDTWKLPTFGNDTNLFLKERKQCTIRHAQLKNHINLCEVERTEAVSKLARKL